MLRERIPAQTVIRLWYVVPHPSPEGIATVAYWLIGPRNVHVKWTAVLFKDCGSAFLPAVRLLAVGRTPHHFTAVVLSVTIGVNEHAVSDKQTVELLGGNTK